jgi:NAD(P)H-dependent FMN reductase
MRERGYMTTIIGLCGSLRRGSFNRMLLRAAVEATPPGTSIEPESIREIPPYDGDVEDEQGVPPSSDSKIGSLKQMAC